LGVPPELVRSVEKALDWEGPKKPWQKLVPVIVEEEEPVLDDEDEMIWMATEALDIVAQKTVDLLQESGLLIPREIEPKPVAPILIKTSAPKERQAIIKQAVEKAIEEVLAR
jgi:hypothetical protein